MFTKRLLPALLTSVVAVTSAVAQSPVQRIEIATPIQLSLQKYTLANGLTVILAPDHSAPVVAVNVWYHVGSANEEIGRTGFAHLFEHMMFQGSENVGDDMHFGLIEEAGGTLNGSTSYDRTNYYEAVPANFLEQMLWLESDRMAALLPAMTQAKLDNQRSVVQNERRERIENQPYGLAGTRIAEALYTQNHPYYSPIIGSMEDLNAASLDDVMAFFRRYYAPNNASLVIAGDFDPATAQRWVERYFSSIPSGPPIERPAPDPVHLTAEKRIVLEDRVQLPRLYLTWPSPSEYRADDAELSFIGMILGGGESARLHQRLVIRDQLAQFVYAGQDSRTYGGEFEVIVQARPGVDLEAILSVVDEEVERLRSEPPTDEEMERALNNLEAGLIQQTQTMLGKADLINSYQVFTGDPGYIEEDLERYRAVTRESLLAAIDRYLGSGRVILSVVPQGQTDLQAMAEVAR